MSHTPGPYEHRRFGDEPFYTIVDDQLNDLAIISENPNIDGDQQLSNAQLFAAAPELLAACKEFVRKVECGEARSKRSYAQMKAAIAKAEKP